MKKLKLFGTRLITSTQPRTPNVIKLKEGDKISDINFVEGDLLDADSVKIVAAQAAIDSEAIHDAIEEEIDTLSEQLDGRLDTVEDGLGQVSADILLKQDAPQESGVSGQILSLDSNNLPVWIDPSEEVIVDTQLSENSTNAVENRAIASTINDILDGTTPPASAQSIQNWIERGDTPVEDIWQGQFRTSAGATSINSENGTSLVSIAAKNEDFYAEAFKTSGFNLLRLYSDGGNAITIGSGFYFPVPTLPFGALNTANEPNGVLFTDNDGNNLKPTVLFKPASSGVPPTSVNDGDPCQYTDADGYRFYTTSQPGYIIVSGITHANTCAHLGWSRRYDEFISPTDADDEGMTISLTSIMAKFPQNRMRTINNTADSVSFDSDSNIATTYQRVGYKSVAANEWTNEQQESSEGENITYKHSIVISDMKPDSAVVSYNNIQLSVDGKTVSYSDSLENGSAISIKYELASAVVSTVNNVNSSGGIEDWGLEGFYGSIADATITQKYYQGIVDAVYGLLSLVKVYQQQVIAHALCELKEEIDAIKDSLKNYNDSQKAFSYDSLKGYMIMGQKVFDTCSGSPTEKPKSIGLYRFDPSTRTLYISKSVTNAVSDWAQVA